MVTCGSYDWNGMHFTVSGSYTDTFPAITVCDSIVTFQLTLNPAPLPFLGKDTVLCAGDSIVLTPGIFNTYLWNDNTVENRLIAIDTGTYWVQVTDANNCRTSDSIKIRSSGQCSCLLDDRTKIYPTPFTDFLLIDKSNTQCEVRMNLYNMLGQVLVKNIVIVNGLNKIPLSNLADGMYVYMLHAQGKILLIGNVMKLR